MKANFRTVVMPVSALIIAITAVVFVTSNKKGGSTYTEIIPVGGLSSSERTPKGLQLQVRSSELAIAVPSCDLTRYPDKFFLHLYLNESATRPKTPFLNMDFNLANEKPVQTDIGGNKTCTYTKSYKDYSVKAISVGQFAQVGNQCCTLKWSRFFAFGTEFPLYEDANGLLAAN